MADQKNIDRVAKKIASQLGQVEENIISEILKTVQNTMRAGTAGSFIEILDQFNFKELVKIKAQNAIASFSAGHLQVLKETFPIAEIAEETLLALKNFSESRFLEHLGSMASTIKEEIARGAIAGISEAQILQSVQRSAGLSTSQLETIVTTSLNNYSRSVTRVMIDKAPVDTKYVYIGPIDDRTRDECLDMASAGALTLEQIQSQFGDAVLVDGGGFNCRHKWEIASQETFFHDARTAKEQASA